MDHERRLRKVKDRFWLVRQAMALPLWRRLGPLIAATICTVAILVIRDQTPTMHKISFGVIVFSLTYGFARMIWINFLNIRPMNLMFRYFAVQDILDAWERLIPGSPRILEVGSGPQGLGHLIDYPFWGCDVKFDRFNNPNLRPVVCSGTNLPFSNDSFDFVISLDTLEHVPADADRCKAVEDMMRVARKAVIVGYPTGPEASAADHALARHYETKGLDVPAWLNEHLVNGLPRENLVESIIQSQYPIVVLQNEDVRLHLWLLKSEAFRPFFYVSHVVVFLARQILRVFGRIAPELRQPYRKIYLIAKDPAFLRSLPARISMTRSVIPN